MRKNLRAIAVLICILFVLLFVGRNIFIKVAVETGVSIITGMKMKIGKLNIGIFKTEFGIQDVVVFNPKSYEEPVLLDLPEIFIDYNLKDIIGGLIHLEKLVFDLKTFNVVRNSSGKLNLSELIPENKGQTKTKEVKENSKAETKGEPLKFQVDSFDLRFGKLSFINYEGSVEKPKINAFEMNLNEHYENITTPHFLVALIVQKAILKAAYAKVTGFDMSGVQNAFKSSLGEAQKVASKAVDSAKEISSDVVEVGGKAVDKTAEVGAAAAKTAAEAAKETVDVLKEQGKVLKGLAGKLVSDLKSAGVE